MSGSAEIAQMLIERGARRDIRDLLYDATPAEWAQHAGHAEIAERLRA